MIIISDSCHKYNISKLDKNIMKYPMIKVETKLLKHLTGQSSSEKSVNFKHISTSIVLFNDLNPLSNWVDTLKNDYANIVRKTRTKYIDCYFLEYTNLKDYIIRPKNPLVYSKKSTIQGKGLFALKAIPKGTEIMRFIDQIHGNHFMYDDSYLINHSSKHPNLQFKYVHSNGCVYSVVVSNKLIHKDEELLVNYLTCEEYYPWLGGITFEEK